jgi:hypothetical protein
MTSEGHENANIDLGSKIHYHQKVLHSRRDQDVVSAYTGSCLGHSEGDCHQTDGEEVYNCDHPEAK